MNGQTVKKGLLVGAGGVLVVTALIICSDMQAVARSIGAVDMAYVPAVILLIPLNYCIKCLRYHYYLRLCRLRVKVKDEIYSLLAASVMVVTPGKWGEVFLRGYLLQVRSYSISLLTICAMALADRLTEGLAMVVMAALTASGLGLSGSVQTRGVYLVLGGLVALVLVLQQKNLCLKALEIGSRVSLLKKAMETCGAAYQQSYVIFTARPLIVSVLLGVVSWSCEAGVVYYSLHALGEQLAFDKIVFAVSASGLLGALSMIPGGIGIADGTLLGLLLFCGLDRGVAGIVTIISRFSTMWLGVVLGGALLWQDRAALEKVINKPN